MEFAYYLLIIAFFFALMQFFYPLIFLHQKCLHDLKWVIPVTWSQLLLVALAFFSLMQAFLDNDFSLRYVAENSNSHLPWIYRLCAVWGGHEGSILLWVFILNLWTTAVTVFNRHLDLVVLARVLAVLGFISAGFLLFLITLSNPFITGVENILDGRDLNPLLQDPGLVFHPPLLYMGYVGFSVTFAFAIAALLSNRLDGLWARWVRPWTLAAWCFLTLGIVSGSWWAYRVLGWGGWWFWDPVENASLLPWLAGTALIHSLLVLEKKELLKTWVILLAILTFALSLIGTFIVRSGILVSVHAFAVDPKRGVFMLGLLGIIVGAALLLYGFRIKRFKVKPYSLSLLSKETLLIGNNILLSVSVFTVLLGTLYPLIIEVLGLGKLSVGAPYFNIVFLPFAYLLLLLMGISYCVNGSKTEGRNALISTIGLLAGALSISLFLIIFFTEGLQWKVIIGLALALWIILNTLQVLWKCYQRKLKFKQILRMRGGMLLAHLGVAISAIGIILSSTYSLQRDVRMITGDSLQLGAYQFKLQSVYGLQGPNYTGAEASLQLINHSATYLKPQLRYYPLSDMALSKPAIDANVWRDLYIALAEPLGNNAWALRFYTKPFIRWIWMGGLLMIAGGICSIVSRQSYLSKATIDIVKNRLKLL
ncbi:MAG: heme lyase CcmF/NrfE family subunit [Pseudomonadota bacterium]